MKRTFAVADPGEKTLRDLLLTAALIWATVLTAITELLSLFELLTFSWVLSAWIVVFSVTGVYLFSRRRKLRPTLKIEPLAPSSIALLCCVVLIVGAIGVIALKAPPNNWDSMTYHMSRVALWTQNQSVDFYPTHNQRQLILSPWAEYAITHLQILSGSDRFANMVQWLSLVGCIIAVTAIAQELGADRRGQVFAAALAATIPMGILQASSTQNDLVLAFWLTCLVYFSLRFRRDPSAANGAMIGLSLGLAVLTKGTAAFYAPPFLIWPLFTAWKRLRFRAWKPVAVIGFVALSLNVGHFARSFDTYGTPIADAGFAVTNSAYGASFTISNVMRSVVLHTTTPNEPVNRLIERSVFRAHTVLQVKADDPRTNFVAMWPPAITFQNSHNHEDLAGNPAHLLALCAAALVLLTSRSLRKNKALVAMFALTAAGFLAQALFLKWQPWGSRLHLPVFILWSPLIALVFSHPRIQKLSSLALALLVLLALPIVIGNATRPLTGDRNIFNTPRIDQYFRNKSSATDSSVRDAYVGAIDFVRQKGYDEVGLETDIDDWDYPLYVLARYKRVGARFTHVNVKNASASTAGTREPYPPVIISTLPQEAPVTVRSDGFVVGWASGPVTVFIKK